jgi:hypothetical protein
VYVSLVIDEMVDMINPPFLKIWKVQHSPYKFIVVFGGKHKCFLALGTIPINSNSRGLSGGIKAINFKQ